MMVHRSGLAAPLILAEPRTILFTYARQLACTQPTLTLEAPAAAFPVRPGSSGPVFTLADITNPATRAAWLRRIYVLRQRWPRMPVGVIAEMGSRELAHAYAAGANRVFHNVNALEQMYFDLSQTKVVDALSERKAQILMGYSVGRSQQMVADELFIDAETVKSHTRDLFCLLGVRSKPMLVHRAFTDALLPYPPPQEDDEFPLTAAEAATVLAIGTTGSQSAAAEVLDRSALTVKTHAQNIRQRVGWSVSEAIANVWRYGQHQRVALQLA